jgi:hypothetical protein
MIDGVIQTGVQNPRHAVKPAGGDEDVHSEHRLWNPHRDGRGDREGRNLSPEGPGPKAFGSNVHDTRFTKCFHALSNVIKYDSKTNPNVWLEDYCLACWAEGADDDLFIIQFIPISQLY